MLPGWPCFLLGLEGLLDGNRFKKTEDHHPPLHFQVHNLLDNFLNGQVLGGHHLSFFLFILGLGLVAIPKSTPLPQVKQRRVCDNVCLGTVSWASEPLERTGFWRGVRSCYHICPSGALFVLRWPNTPQSPRFRNRTVFSKANFGPGLNPPPSVAPTHFLTVCLFCIFRQEVRQTFSSGSVNGV